MSNSLSQSLLIANLDQIEAKSNSSKKRKYIYRERERVIQHLRADPLSCLRMSVCEKASVVEDKALVLLRLQLCPKPRSANQLENVKRQRQHFHNFNPRNTLFN